MCISDTTHSCLDWLKPTQRMELYFAILSYYQLWRVKYRVSDSSILYCVRTGRLANVCCIQRSIGGSWRPTLSKGYFPLTLGKAPATPMELQYLELILLTKLLMQFQAAHVRLTGPGLGFRIYLKDLYPLPTAALPLSSPNTWASLAWYRVAQTCHTTLWSWLRGHALA